MLEVSLGFDRMLVARHGYENGRAVPRTHRIDPDRNFRYRVHDVDFCGSDRLEYCCTNKKATAVIYAIHNPTERAIKVGKADCIATRLATLQTASATPLELVGYVDPAI
jgi:hypothetical protein